MKRKLLIVSVIASAAIGAANLASAQTAPAGSDAKKETTEAKKDATKVYHAGGKHDQKAHEASVRAKEAGKKMEEPTMHPGGKHDVTGHKAALKAEQKEAEATKK
jgi:Ni/Co efflux regulator RcnB